MENSAVHDQDIPLFQADALPVQSGKATAFFNIHDLHLTVPVVIQCMKDLTVRHIGFHRQLKGTVRA